MNDTNSPTQQQNETVNQQIDRLNQSVLNLQTLADRARAQGDFVRALKLSNQSVALSGDINRLCEQQQVQAFESSTWQILSAKLDALNVEAQMTEGRMQDASNNVETAKTIIGLVGKLVSAF
jgi:hypothetical protein